MAANTSPIFPITPQVTSGGVFATVATANTAKDGTGTIVWIYTAGAFGGYLNSVKWMPLGTNTASVGRVFLNNSLTNATPANNQLLADISLPATTNSEIAAISTAAMTLTLNLGIPATWRVGVAIGTTVAAGWNACPSTGDY